MLKSSDYVTNLYLKEIEKEKALLDSYVIDAQKRYFISFTESDNLMDIFSDNLNGLNYDNLSNLRDYTGYKYRKINSILRGIVASDEIGVVTSSEKDELASLESSISEIIEMNSQLPSNIKTYRGTTIEQFVQFGIYSLEELAKLKGEFMYEPSFTSTSLLRNRSFFKSKSDYHDICNIEIEYLIPEESNCGIPLVGYDMSYSSEQKEYLIDKGTVTKILDVTYDEDGFAHLRALHIPKHIWNKPYSSIEAKPK